MIFQPATRIQRENFAHKTKGRIVTWRWLWACQKTRLVAWAHIAMEEALMHQSYFFFLSFFSRVCNRSTHKLCSRHRRNTLSAEDYWLCIAFAFCWLWWCYIAWVQQHLTRVLHATHALSGKYCHWVALLFPGTGYTYAIHQRTFWTLSAYCTHMLERHVFSQMPTQTDAISQQPIIFSILTQNLLSEMGEEQKKTKSLHGASTHSLWAKWILSASPWFGMELKSRTIFSPYLLLHFFLLLYCFLCKFLLCFVIASIIHIC